MPGDRKRGGRPSSLTDAQLIAVLHALDTRTPGERGWTPSQRAIAEDTGVSQPTISAILNRHGIYLPRVQALVAAGRYSPPARQATR